MLRRYRHVMWDWNGTLLDDLDLSIEIVNGMLARRALPVMTRARYHATFDFPVRNYDAALGFDVSAANFHALSVEFIDEYNRRRLEARLHREAEATLDAVLAAGLTQSILSAYRHNTLCEIVDHFRLTRRFTQLAGLDDIYAHSKAALGRSCIASLGVPARDVLLIGDTLHDFEVAAEIGVDCLLVAHGHHPLGRLSARTPRVVADLSALRSALEI